MKLLRKIKLQHSLEKRLYNKKMVRALYTPMTKQSLKNNYTRMNINVTTITNLQFINNSIYN